MADEVERAAIPVWPEQQARDAVAVLAIADDDAVAGLVVLHLHHRFARAGLVREVSAFAHDTVEADRLEPLEPARGLLPVRRLRRQRERGRAFLELESPLRERAAMDRLAVPEQDVERDER